MNVSLGVCLWVGYWPSATTQGRYRAARAVNKVRQVQNNDTEMVGGSRLGFNRKRKKRLCAFEELAWLVFLLLLAFLLALSQHLSVEVLAEKTYISSLVEVHIVTMQTNIYIAYSRKSRKWCLQNFVELFFLFFYFAILYERNLSKIR